MRTAQNTFGFDPAAARLYGGGGARAPDALQTGALVAKVAHKESALF